MGWGLTVDGVYLNCVTKDGMDSAIEDAQSECDGFRKMLFGLAARLAAPTDGQTVAEAVSFAIANLEPMLDDYEDAVFTRGVLLQAKDNGLKTKDC